MPFRTSTTPGAPIWIDLLSSDPARMRDFYAEVFGWTYEVSGPEFGNYVMFRHRGRDVAGMAGKQQPEMPDAWTVYLHSEDADRSMARVAEAGGTVMCPAMSVGEAGRMAIAQDTTGAFVGVWQPGDHHGTGVWDEDGAPAWVELHATDYRAAIDFYTAAFDWQTEVSSDTPELRYTVQLVEGVQRAGVMDGSTGPVGMPAHWRVYLGCDDVDATQTAVEKHGGSVAMPAMDTPYGRMAAVADPGGARFMLISVTGSAQG